MNKFFLVGLLFLAGCASTAKYEEILKTWVGEKESSLVASWGPPDSVYNISDSEKMLTYFRSNNVTLPGSAPTYTTNFIGNTAYTTSYGGTPPTNLNLHCKTTFTVADGVITSWRWEGNNCVSR